jgi:putative oxidoreductase
MRLQLCRARLRRIAIMRINQSREFVMSATLIDKGNAASATLLRVALGVMYLTHSIVLKVFTFGFAGTAGYFASLGLPSATAYVVIAAEAVGGVLLLANVRAGWVSLGLLPVLLGALWVHSGNGWVFSASGGGWEYPLFLIVVSVAVALQAVAARPARSGAAPRAAGSALHGA